MYSAPVLTTAGTRVYRCLVLIWTLANLTFWSWWLQPEHIASGWLYAVFTLAYAYETSFLPTMYLFYLGRMRRPRPCAAPANQRVALITLCVPKAESLDVIVGQLEALAAVDYPHDSWILDEGNDPAVRAAAERCGVRYFTRRGITRYNQPDPPFKARTKAGNVNAWLDAHGHDYDVFVQFDIDHAPASQYLDRVLGYFRDPEVAWVQGPSLYGNLGNWVARGAAEQELVLQGPLQLGFYGASETPFIIGSHCSYRTAAILEIGGFQPTRAEDHLDTVILAAHGYRGVFVDEVFAVGQGPDTFDTYLRQQFAWAYSMIQVLVQHTPRLVRHYRPVQAIQFLFAQTWYVCWSTSMLILFLTPLLALLNGTGPSFVALPDFLLASIPVQLTSLGVWMWSRQWQQPAGVGLSWRGVILHVARWPIVCWAFLNVLLRIQHPYMITPKGDTGRLPPFTLRGQAIYLALAWLSTATIWLYLAHDGGAEVQGYVLFTLLGCVLMLAVVGANVGLDLAEVHRRGIGLLRATRLRAAPLAMLSITLLLTVGTMVATRDEMVVAAAWTGPPAAESGSAAYARELLHDAAARQSDHDAAARLSETPVTGEGTTITSRAPTRPSPVALVVPAEPAILPMELPSDYIAVGAYDPELRLAGLPLDLEHWYVRQNEPEQLTGALVLARNRRSLLVTIEPFPSRRQREPVPDATVAGHTDAELRQLARVVRAATPQVVLLRWGHEMDISGLYPWAANEPSLYRAAFRRVVMVFREEGATNARWVWSPAGNAGVEAYYPGDDVVDYVGLTVLGDETWDAGFGVSAQSFVQLLQPRYERVVGFNKPIIIAELGVSGTLARQTAWLNDAAIASATFPALRALVYFDDVNATNTQLSHRPDWHLEPWSFDRFRAAVAAAAPAPGAE